MTNPLRRLRADRLDRPRSHQSPGKLKQSLRGRPPLYQAFADAGDTSIRAISGGPPGFCSGETRPRATHDEEASFRRRFYIKHYTVRPRFAVPSRSSVLNRPQRSGPAPWLRLARRLHLALASDFRVLPATPPATRASNAPSRPAQPLRSTSVSASYRDDACSLSDRGPGALRLGLVTRRRPPRGRVREALPPPAEAPRRDQPGKTAVYAAGPDPTAPTAPWLRPAQVPTL